MRSSASVSATTTTAPSTGGGGAAGAPPQPAHAQAQASPAPPLPPLDAATLRRAAETSLDRWSRAASDAAADAASGRLVLLDVARDVAAQFYAVLSVAWRPEATRERPGGGALAPLASVAAYALVVVGGRRPAGIVAAWIASTFLGGSLVIFLLFRLLGSPNSLGTVARVVGLSLLPLTVLEPLMTLLETPLPVLGYAVKCVAVLWAARAASVFLVAAVPHAHEAKALLLAYPVVLLHLYMLNLRR